MKKLILALIIMLFVSLGFGQSIILNNVGMYAEILGDQIGKNGETVFVRVDYTTDGVASVDGTYLGTNFDFVYVMWYDNIIPVDEDYLGIELTPITNWVSGGIGINKVATFEFTMPTPNPGGVESLQLIFGLYEDGGYGGDYMLSYIDWNIYFACIGNPPTNYFEYLEFIEDLVTEPIVLDKPEADGIFQTNFIVQYDQLEYAYSGTVKLTFRRGYGEPDPGEPHVLEVSSEAAGIDIILNLNATDLSGSVGIESLLSGTNALVEGTNYGVKIEYDDLAQNGVEFNENYAPLYSNDPYVITSGGDYKKGLFIRNSKNNALLRFHFRASHETVTIDSLEFEDYGAYENSDYDSLNIWESDDDEFDSNEDEIIATQLVFFTSEFVFDPPLVVDSIGTYYFATINTSSSADNNDKIGIELKVAVDIKSSSYVIGDFPIGNAVEYYFGGYGNLTVNYPISISEMDNELYYGDLTDLPPAPPFNTKFITFDGTNYADVSSFIPADVLDNSAFSISLWKKSSDDATLVGSFDSSSNFFEIKMVK